MTWPVYQLRASNIEQLIKARFEGSQAKFARAIERSPSMVHQWVKGWRQMGERSTRRIERVLALPKYALDQCPESTTTDAQQQDHAKTEHSAQRRIQPSPFQARQRVSALGEFTRNPQERRADLEAMGCQADLWVCGVPVAPFQRDIGQWSVEQQQQFIMAAWFGLDLGTLVIVDDPGFNRESAFANMLIDGQHRLQSLEHYVNDQFPVMGYYWSELYPADHRAFQMATKITVSYLDCHDEQTLRAFYDLLNHGGVQHAPDETVTGEGRDSAYRVMEGLVTKP